MENADGQQDDAEREAEEMLAVLMQRHGASSDDVNEWPKTDGFLLIIGAISNESRGGVEALRGLNILDLGCGSIETSEEESMEDEKRNCEPWIARLLHTAGAHVVGIDLGDLSKEEFEGHRVDLSRSGALDFLPSSSFDVVHMRNLLDKDASSPRLIQKFAINWNSGDMEGMVSREEMEKEIRKQALRLLKDGGVFIYNRTAYKKIDGSFVPRLTGRE